MSWREGERRVVSVTPVARGLFRPILAAVAAVVVVEFATRRVLLLHQHRLVLLVLLVGPCMVVVATRTWRWRSHKIHVTNQRVIAEGGVANHYRSSVELRDVIATRAEQRLSERLTRRGTVLLETAAGTLNVGRVHHPAALCRLIDLERASYQSDGVPLDTVFEFDHPATNDFGVNPRWRRDWR
jgi:membrane protein YdbS with pleckstrin-like domain